MYASYAVRDHQRGLKIGIGRERFDELIVQPCTYCGHLDGARNTLDRVDSALGYTEANVVPCCGMCNRAKGALPLAMWEAYLARIAAFKGHS